MTTQPYPLADILAQQAKGAFEDGIELGTRLGFMQRQRVAYVVGGCWGAVLCGLTVWFLMAAGYL